MIETLRSKLGNHFVITALIIGIVVSSLGIGYAYGRESSVGAQVPLTITNADGSITLPKNTDFALFWKVWNLLDEKYGGTAGADVTDQDRVYSAIQGLASAYGDPYTTFFPPEESKSFEEDISGSFEGVGMEVTTKDNRLTVVAPLRGSPAEKAGVKAKDIIYKIDGTESVGMSIDQAIKLIKGPRGSKVVITVIREGAQAPLDISITRDVIRVPTIETELRNDGVFVIRFYTFGAEASEEFRKAMQEFITAYNNKSTPRVKSLIIDLRGNPGGYLDAAVEIASWFLDEGEIIVTERFKDKPVENHTSRGYTVIPKDVTIVALIDGGSASASEILAGALQDYDKATLIGEKSFGKGSVQEYIKTTADTALKVTVAEWLTPKGSSISKNGLTPDIEVKREEADQAQGLGDTLKADTDNQFARALEFIQTSR